ncbi:hypothetical protein EJV47_21070 [Hymenobacter gummosus]|uniref:Tetratricopeptide repeat protein n=1 Tax=Hymenobacter gummosus TaxID=1776032 RepID=A0A431TYH0_9BACT|nr:hypothetical protein [Hymenobacter gummosus]RTQ46865.1 hypothetical protein EJV47_21070 [Hymenobacter gummosus]
MPDSRLSSALRRITSARGFLLAAWLLAAGGAARAQQPDSAEYYFQLGAGYMNTGPVTLRRALGAGEAIGDYTKAQSFDSTYYWAYRNRAYCLEYLQQPARALADYQRAVAAGARRGDPNADDQLLSCARLSEKLGRYADAELAYTRFLALPHLQRQGGAAILLARGDVRRQLQLPTQAADDYRRCLQVIYHQLWLARTATDVYDRSWRQQEVPALRALWQQVQERLQGRFLGQLLEAPPWEDEPREDGWYRKS